MGWRSCVWNTSLVFREWTVWVSSHEPGHSDCQQIFSSFFSSLHIARAHPKATQETTLRFCFSGANSGRDQLLEWWASPEGTASCPSAQFSATLMVSKWKSRRNRQKSQISAHKLLKAFAACLSPPRAIGGGSNPFRQHFPKPSEPRGSVFTCPGRCSWLALWASVLLTHGWRAPREVQSRFRPHVTLLTWHQPASWWGSVLPPV